MHYRKDEQTGQITILMRSYMFNDPRSILLTKAIKDEAVQEGFQVESAVLSQEIADIVSNICEFETFNHNTMPDFLSEEEKYYIRDLVKIIKGA